MKIFFPEIHPTLTQSICTAFGLLGHKVILPSKDYSVTYRAPQQFNQHVWNESVTEEFAKSFGDNCSAWSKERILDEPPDLIFVSHFESQFEILNELMPKTGGKSKLAFYSGNDYWEGAYPEYRLVNYLAADFVGRSVINKVKPKNSYRYCPYIHYDKLQYAGVSDSNLVCSYVNQMEQHWPDLYKELNENIRETCKDAELKILSGESHEKISELRKKSCATIHIKPIEGYGYSIIESLAVGRPVFIPKIFSANRSFTDWVIENQTGFYFFSTNELRVKLTLLINNQEYRHLIQDSCAKIIRKIVNNDQQQATLKNFLEDLV